MVFLEAQVQNITTSPMCMEHVNLESSQYYNVVTLSHVPKRFKERSNKEEDSNDKKELFSISYMNPMDMRQYLYKLIPKQDQLRELRSKVCLICVFHGLLPVNLLVGLTESD